MTRQPKSMVPKVRFKGFTDEWEQRKLGDVLFGFKYGLNTPAIDYDGQNKYLRITDIDDNTHQFMQDKLTSPKNRDDSYLLKSGDILFARTGASVGKTYEYHPEDGKVYYAGFLIKGSTSNNNDASFIFFSTLLNRYIRFVKVTSMRSGQPGINANEYKKYSLYIPQKNEQCRISKLLKKIDAIITLQQRKLDQLNTLKKGLLQKMFADKKHPKPELRFKSFHDNWINHKAGDFMIERNQKATIDDDFPLKAFIANKGVADKGERYDRSAITNDASNKMYKRTLFNDFIYSSNNLETGSIGLNKYGNASISPVYSIFYFKNKESADFFGRILVRKEFINSMIRYRQGVVYGQWRIKEKDFLNISISVPSLEEQEKIGSLLDKLDETINVNSKLLNQLKVLKKSLLQTMFI